MILCCNHTAVIKFYLVSMMCIILINICYIIQPFIADSCFKCYNDFSWKISRFQARSLITIFVEYNLCIILGKYLRVVLTWHKSVNNNTFLYHRFNK